MLHLDEELKALEGLGNIIDSAINKTQIEINKAGTEEGKVVSGFMNELKEAMATGKGIKELQKKVNDYANNRN